MIGKYFVFLVTIGAAAAVTKVPVTIYYETLCSDSMKFFTKQFVPTWADLKDYIGPLMLIPYGKTVTNGQSGQSRTFDCHHGSNECLGNKLQSCVLDASDNIPLDAKISYINCLMTNATEKTDYTITANACKRDGGVDVTLAITCMNNENGDRLLAANGEKTNSFQNPLQSAPTIVFNNQFKKAESDDSINVSFRGALCKYIPENERPATCKVNGAPITTIGLMTLFTAGLVARLL